jgi:hypothetical protein
MTWPRSKQVPHETLDIRAGAQLVPPRVNAPSGRQYRQWRRRVSVSGKCRVIGNPALSGEIHNDGEGAR